MYSEVWLRPESTGRSVMMRLFRDIFGYFQNLLRTQSTYICVHIWNLWYFLLSLSEKRDVPFLKYLVLCLLGYISANSLDIVESVRISNSFVRFRKVLNECHFLEETLSHISLAMWMLHLDVFHIFLIQTTFDQWIKKERLSLRSKYTFIYMWMFSVNHIEKGVDEHFSVVSLFYRFLRTNPRVLDTLITATAFLLVVVPTFLSQEEDQFFSV